MPFDFKNSGLPQNEKFDVAAQLCYAWLEHHMKAMFGEDGIQRFMNDQPVTAAKRLLSETNNPSEESVIVALLGPAKAILDGAQGHPQFKAYFGDRAVQLFATMQDFNNAKGDANLTRDAKRLFLVEALSTMGDQMIGRKRWDAHHDTRWKILKSFEQNFAVVKGENPKLDVLFEDYMTKSKGFLTAIDQKRAKDNKPPKSGM